ncbi:MAG: hypothetical protein GY827_00450, partial [Cytophagales bacterium]|nr:hypothetical protein [Cytophagales bacterium]
MKKIIYLYLVFLCHLGLAQTGYLQVFSSGGKQVSANNIVLQGTIGEAIMYSTNTNYTQGFQQPVYIYVCGTLAQFKSGLDTTICLDDTYDLALKYDYTTVEWWSKEQDTLLSSSLTYSYPTDVAVKDSVFAIVVEGVCTDTSKVVGLEVVSLDT